MLVEGKQAPECFGKFLATETNKCEQTCNKDEQLLCHVEFAKIEKRKEVQIEVDIPWYKRKEHSGPDSSCATNRNDCE